MSGSAVDEGFDAVEDALQAELEGIPRIISGVVMFPGGTAHAGGEGVPAGVEDPGEPGSRGGHPPTQVEGPEAVAGVQILVWPLGFLCSIFVAPSTMPAWLGAIAAWNPLSSTATAIRHLFGNPGVTGHSWVVGHAIGLAILWPLLITAVFAPLAGYRYRHLDR